MRRLTTLLVFMLAVAIPALAFAFSPSLENEDSKNYGYEFECGGLTENGRIKGNSSTSLGSSSEGCTLKVKGAGSAELESDMECVIEDGSLSCS